MKREQITRRDFPTGRRGYEPSAVDEHLRQLADEMERLRERAAGASRTAVAAGASEHVRTILEAAERSAAELREQGAQEAAEHVARVQEATSGMLARVDELERELAGLIDALRRSGERLRGDLARLQAEVERARSEELGEPLELAAPEPPALAPPEPPRADATPALAPPEPPAGEPLGEEDYAASAPAQVEGEAIDDAGARLIALNMALSGTPREETARYLSEHFALADQEALLDDVYARAGR